MNKLVTFVAIFFAHFLIRQSDLNCLFPNIHLFIIPAKFVNWTILDANLDFLKAFSNPGMMGF